MTPHSRRLAPRAGSLASCLVLACGWGITMAIAVALALVGPMAAPPAVAAGAQPLAPHPLIDAKHELELLRPRVRVEPAAAQLDFDVLHYDLDLDIDFPNQLLAGTLRLTAESKVAALTVSPPNIKKAR